jgi:hypothetical protein
VERKIEMTVTVKILQVVLITGALFFLPACWMQSLQPLYGDGNEALFDDALLGKWELGDGAQCSDVEQKQLCTITLTRSSGNRYRLEHNDEDGRKSVLAAHLVQLGGRRFFDFYPSDDDSLGDCLTGVVALHIIGAHTFWQMSTQGDTLRLTPMDGNWVSNSIKAGKLKVTHVQNREGDVLLTALPAELQKLVAAHADDQHVFRPDTTYVWKRKSTEGDSEGAR